eukprot:8385819-Alexandrium_andersonii.AAC.1
MPRSRDAQPDAAAGAAPDAAPSQGGGTGSPAPGALAAGLPLNETNALRGLGEAQRREERLVAQRRHAYRNAPASKHTPSEEMLRE